MKGLQYVKHDHKRSDDWEHTMAALTLNEIPYHYKNNGQWLEYSHPTIVLSEFGGSGPWLGSTQLFSSLEWLADAFQAVRWSPPFQASLLHDAWESKGQLFSLDYWLAGAKILQHEFQQEEATFQTKLPEGSCIIFDNWRVLHARKGFRGGERWLRGAYIGDTEFQQRMLELASEPFETRPPNR